MTAFHLAVCIVLLAFTQAKPVYKEVLPHSKDYYAGYIKAITDNFEQLFATERQVRSAPEEEEQADIDDDTAKRSIDKVESIDDIKHYDGSIQKTLTEIKRDVNEDVDLKKNDTEIKKSNAAVVDKIDVKFPEKKDASLVTTENVVKDDEATAEKTVSASTKSTDAKSTDEDSPAEKENAIVKLADSTDGTSDEESEDATETSPADTETGIVDQEAASTDEEDEGEPGNEEASENEEDVPVEFHSNMPMMEGGDDEGDMRRDYILEHAGMQNVQFAPKIISGFQGNVPPQMPFGNDAGNEYMFPGAPMGLARPQMGNPFNYGYPQQMAAANYMPQQQEQQEDEQFTGDARSNIDDVEEASKRDGDSKKDKDKVDNHHLDRVLVLPGCQNHCGCGHDVHHCGCGHDVHHCGCGHDVHHCGCGHDVHHDCGCGCDHVYECGCDHHHDCGCGCDSHHTCIHPDVHYTHHDIHHWPVGCPEHYSHTSPCLTYPHSTHVGYGFPHDSCGCDCGCHHPSHTHHSPVILHPTCQETHHHNIHVVHDNGCHHDNHHLGCGEVHHIQLGHEHCGHHGCHECHSIPILPHYGHTCAGHGGWNPYWGH